MTYKYNSIIEYMCTKIHTYIYQSYYLLQDGVCIKEIVQTQQISQVMDASLTKIITLLNTYEQDPRPPRHLLAGTNFTSVYKGNHCPCHCLVQQKSRLNKAPGDACPSNCQTLATYPHVTVHYIHPRIHKYSSTSNNM